MSKQAIEGLQPELIWQRFYEISQVPRPSKKEGRIIEYLKDFAGKNNLELKEDKVGNLVIKVPATPGLENARTIVLQGHVDMVCEKNKGTEHDFDNDPIKLLKEGDWITADGTTLGSDNGIGVAAALAVATDPNIKHGPIECLFTVDEETGLTGANNLQPGFITGKTLLNLDSEEDGAFYVGCSGGQDTAGTFNIETEDCPAGYGPYRLVVSGLKGGHSGLDIITGRANAIKLLARALNRLRSFDFYVAHIEGGSKRNAIPREAEALLFVKEGSEAEAVKKIEQLEKDALNEFKKADSGIKITLSKAEGVPGKVFTKAFSGKIRDVLLGIPHGVIAMSADIPGLVETSSNLATVVMTDGKLVIGTSQRSSIESAKANIAGSVYAVLNLAGGEISQGDGYPGWKPNLDSEILSLSRKIFEVLFNEEPEVKAIHAGLECGILGDKYPGLDMVSFGPTIMGAHSPDEKVYIPAVERFYQLLKGILEEYAVLK